MKKWIKGFFPHKQTKSTSTTIQTTKVQKNQQGWTEAEAQIVNHLINMDSLIKISKHLNQEQYLTLSQINEILCQETIDLSDARKALLGGLQILQDNGQNKYMTKHLPFQYYSVRSLLWKILLGYLSPSQKQKWISQMQKNLSTYRQHIYQYIVVPIQKKLGLTSSQQKKQSSTHLKEDPCGPCDSKDPCDQKDLKENQEHQCSPVPKDHPLSFSQKSKWANYFKDLQLWTLIEKDIKRTRKSCKFFTENHQILLEMPCLLENWQITFSDKGGQGLDYLDCLTRIIFVYLKENPMESYAQGMNQLAALIFYAFSNKGSEYFRRVGQSDAFEVFKRVMGRLPKRHFGRGQEYVKELVGLIKKLDLRLYEYLKQNGQEEMLKMVTMKWFLSGFLSQFSIDDCILIWDCFIAWPHENVMLTDCFTYMALSVIHLNRQRIVDGENIAIIFGKIEQSVSQIIQKTQSLYKLFPKLLQR